ncbi:hypothetical protein ACJX0J_009147 [Zea mays]
MDVCFHMFLFLASITLNMIYAYLLIFLLMLNYTNSTEIYLNMGNAKPLVYIRWLIPLYCLIDALLKLPFHNKLLHGVCALFPYENIFISHHGMTNEDPDKKTTKLYAWHDNRQHKFVFKKQQEPILILNFTSYTLDEYRLSIYAYLHFFIPHI